MPYLLILVIVRFGRIWPTRPAACHVVPHVSLPCSSSSTSCSPSAARWYAVEQPAMPPPTTTMRACVGSVIATRSGQAERHHAGDDRTGADGALQVEALLQHED